MDTYLVCFCNSEGTEYMVTVSAINEDEAVKLVKDERDDFDELLFVE